MKTYAYIRVSSRDQNIDRQVEAMKEVGIEESMMYIDKKSGKDFDRENYQRLIKRLKKDDVVYIKSIDRLGRNYDEIIEQWHVITREKEADIIVLDFPLLNTKEQVNGLTGKFISDLVLQILSYVAQVERENIKQRQKEGIQIALEKGIKFGRPRKETPDTFNELYQQYIDGNMSLCKVSRIAGVSNHTFKRWMQEYWNEMNDFQ